MPVGSKGRSPPSGAAGFDPAWLALREPYDRDARSPALAAKFGQALGPAATLIDLGTGTGANLRYLLPRLGTVRRWLAVDHDARLLEAGREALGHWAGTVGWPAAPVSGGLRLASPGGASEVQFRQADLTGLAAVLDGSGATGITASALLDLTSATWLQTLADLCQRIPVLIALSFNGRLVWSPADPDDRVICTRFLAHQRNDKGLGPALGPDAAAFLGTRLQAAGHRVELASSDWELHPGADRPLVEAMLDGILVAATAIEADHVLDAWAARRQRQLEAGKLGLTVGHQDLLALPHQGVGGKVTGDGRRQETW